LAKIILGADFLGFELKNIVKSHLEKKGHEIIDIGMYSLDKEIAYYDVAAIAAKKIQDKEAERAVLFCGTGMGVSIVANKFKGIYASVIESEYTAKMSKVINNSNVLTMGGRIISPFKAILAVDLWLDAVLTVGMDDAADFLKSALVEIGKIEDKNFK
jgi:ribose 5-phosphate isomerase B